MIKKAVIPAAGLGTRLFPATYAQPKEMLPCGRIPTIHYVVDELAAAGVTDILIITGRAKRPIEDHFDQDPALLATLRKSGKEKLVQNLQFHDKWRLNFYYTRQTTPTGLADAIGLAKHFIDDESFYVALGDTIIHSDPLGSCLKRLAKLHEKEASSGTILLENLQKKEDVQKYGIIKGSQVGQFTWKIEDLIEKPALGVAPSLLAITGRYIFDSSIFSAIEKTKIGFGGEKHITDSIKILIREEKEVWGEILQKEEKRYDIGNPLTYARAFIELCLMDPEIKDDLKPILKDIVSKI